MGGGGGEQNRNQKSILGVFSPVPFLTISLSFPAAKWPLKSSRERTTFAATRLGSKYTKNAFAAEAQLQTHFGVFRAQRTCLEAANVVLFLLNEIYKSKQMWLFLNVLYVTV